MSTNQLTPVWMTVGATQTAPGTTINGTSMGASITSDAVLLQWEDNPDIQVKWTGTPTGTLVVQVSLDPTNLGWQTVTFSPTPDQPAGTSGSDYFTLNQTAAAYVRLVYTRVSGTGNLYAKIAAKSV